MFKIQEKGRPEIAIWLHEGEPVIIANDGSGDLQFDATTPDSAKIKINLDNDRPYLADMTFNQPIYINDQPIPPGSKRALKHGDRIQIGNSQFEITNPKSIVSKLQVGGSVDHPAHDSGHWHLKAVGNWLDGQQFTIRGKTIIGRDATCTITIPGSHLSRRHAEFLAVGSKLIMRDLDSSNGSFVNGKRCKEAYLNDVDEIRLDVLTFRVIAPEDENLRKTAEHEAARTPTEKSPVHQPLKDIDKNWVTKPTSIGNTLDDPHDLLLAQHLRTKKITYTVFGIVFFILIIVALVII